VSENLFDTWNTAPASQHISRGVVSTFEETEFSMPWRITFSQRGVWYPVQHQEDGWENRIELNKKLTETLSTSLRHEIRRKMRRAAESDKNVRFTIVNGTEDINSEINAFFDLMVQEPGKQEFLHPAMREQMTVTIQNAHMQGYLWLAFLEVEGVKTAASLNFDYRNKLWGYNSGVSREHMELSPGWVLLAHTIQWCCDHGRYEFDFMRGDEEYKYRFGGMNKHVMRAKALKH